jgi:hypothetical protein
MIRNVLSHIGGIEAYGILSILLFFAFFTGMLVWAFRIKPGHLEAMGRIPLHDGTTDPLNPTANPASVSSSSSRPSHECE